MLIDEERRFALNQHSSINRFSLRRRRQEELRDVRSGDMPDADFQIGLDRAARAEHGHPLREIDAAADGFTVRKEDVVFDVQHAGCAVRALEKSEKAGKRRRKSKTKKT